MPGIYAAASELMVTGSFNWTAAAPVLMLVGPGYTPDYVNDSTLANIPSGSQLLATPVALTGLSTSAGFCLAANVTWTGLATSAIVVGMAILLNNGGAQSTWPLIAYIDTGAGFNQRPVGGSATIVFDTRGIFRP